MSKEAKLSWTNSTAKLKDLIPCEENPRTLSDKQRKDLKKSLEKFALAEVPAIDIDNRIVAGHQRIDILKELYGGDYQIDIRVPSRKLTDKEYKEYLVRSNKNTGEWDLGKLNTDFELEELKDWGFSAEDLVIKVDTPPLDLEEEDKNEEQIPQYKIEVKFSNDMEMRDLHDDLVSKGYLVRVLK